MIEQKVLVTVRSAQWLRECGEVRMSNRKWNEMEKWTPKQVGSAGHKYECKQPLARNIRMVFEEI